MIQKLTSVNAGKYIPVKSYILFQC